MEIGETELKKEHRRVIIRFSWILFIIYIVAMAYFLFFSEYLNRGGMRGGFRYNLTLLQEVKRSFWCLRAGDYYYFVLNFIMNIISFVPFGFFLPLISRNRRGRKFWYVMLSIFGVTVAIEVIQLVLKVGTFDVDDILLNTIGGFIGYLFFKITQFIWWMIRKVCAK